MGWNLGIDATVNNMKQCSGWNGQKGPWSLTTDSLRQTLTSPELSEALTGKAFRAKSSGVWKSTLVSASLYTRLSTVKNNLLESLPQFIYLAGTAWPQEPHYRTPIWPVRPGLSFDVTKIKMSDLFMYLYKAFYKVIVIVRTMWLARKTF